MYSVHCTVIIALAILWHFSQIVLYLSQRYVTVSEKFISVRINMHESHLLSTGITHNATQNDIPLPCRQPNLDNLFISCYKINSIYRYC